ncbi:MAG: hypothetical protein ACI31G_01595 [Bacilli bacterium]
MKKTKFFILASTCLFLSSCVSFSNDLLSEGLNFSVSSEDEIGEINYYSGDELSSDAVLVKKYNFKSSVDEGGYISSLEELTSIIKDYDDSIGTLNAVRYVSQGYNGLKLGISSSKAFGKLDIELNFDFKYVEIVACPRISYVFDYSLNETVINIDEDASFKVNEKDFIYVKNISEDDISNGDYLTTMVFEVSETNNLKLFEYNNRAVIQSIAFYNEI